MYAAVFEMSSWMGPEQHIVCGNSAADLLYAFEEIQSLHCLVMMGKKRRG